MPPTVVCYAPSDEKRGFRIVTDAGALPSPCLEVLTGVDAMDVPIWQLVTEHSSPDVLWRAVLALRDHVITVRKA